MAVFGYVSNPDEYIIVRIDRLEKRCSMLENENRKLKTQLDDNAITGKLIQFAKQELVDIYFLNTYLYDAKYAKTHKYEEWALHAIVNLPNWISANDLVEACADVLVPIFNDLTDQCKSTDNE